MTKRLALAVWLATAVLGSTGCGNLWDDLFGESRRGAATPGDAGLCERDPYEMLVTRAGQSCSLANPCPKGSFCNADSVCDWECYRDSQCPAGKACDCAGQCVGTASSIGDAGTVNLECVKNAGLLYGLKPDGGLTAPDAGARECSNDGHCPAGSYCNQGTGYCDWDCHPDIACADGQACDCNGRCVLADAGVGGGTCQRRLLATMSVSPLSHALVISNGTWSNRNIDVTIAADQRSLIASGSTLKTEAQVRARASQGIQICCSLPSAGSCAAADFSSECILPLTGWTFTSSNSDAGVDAPAKASYRIEARPTPGAAATGGNVQFFSAAAANSPRISSFGNLANDVSAPPVLTNSNSTWIALSDASNMRLRGTMTIGTSREGSEITVATAARPIAVTARIEGTKMLILDPMKTLSADGVITVDLNPATTSYVRLLNSLYHLTARTRNAQVQLNPGMQLVKGTFDYEITLGMLPGWNETAPKYAIAHPVQFSMAMVNEDIAIADPGAIDTFPVVDATIEEWTIPTDVAYDSHYLEDPYDKSYGLAAAQSLLSQKKPILLADAFAGYNHVEGKDGQNICKKYFVPAVESLQNAQFVDTANSYQVTWAHWLSPDPEFCMNDDLAGLAANPCGYMYGMGYCGSTPAPQHDQKVPCVDLGNESLVDNALAHYNRTDTTNDGASTYLYRLGCKQLWQNMAGSGSYEQWLSQNKKTKIQVQVKESCTVKGTGGCPNGSSPPLKSYDIYLVQGWRAAVALGPDRALVENYEGLDCYDNWATPVLRTRGYASGADLGNVLPLSGQLKCSDGKVPAVFPLLVHEDAYRAGMIWEGDHLTAAQLFQHCKRELNATPPHLGWASDVETADSFRKAFAPGKCISMGRFAMAMENWAHPTTFLPRQRQGRLIANALANWLRVHSFVAQQGVEEERLRRVLASATKPAMATPTGLDGEPPVLEELVAMLHRSWQPLIKKLVYYNSLYWDLIATRDTTWDSDYRGNLNIYLDKPDWASYQSQWIGLPTPIEELLANQLRLIEAYMDQRAALAFSGGAEDSGAARQQAVDAASQAIRESFLLDAMAVRIYLNSRPNNPEPFWYGRWVRARNEMLGVRENVRRKLWMLTQNRNPLGIEEDDLPVFFGDVSGTNSRYFASSDYLMTTWAVPAVTTAQSALALARDAWISARNSSIQQAMSIDDRDRRVEDIQSKAGQRIIENCGLTDMDSKDVIPRVRGEKEPAIDLSTCFIKPSCLDGGDFYALIKARADVNGVRFKMCTLDKLKSLLTNVTFSTSGYQYVGYNPATGSASNGVTLAQLLADHGEGKVAVELQRGADIACENELKGRFPLTNAIDVLASFDPSCFRGKLGSAMLQVVGAQQDVRIARESWDAAEKSWKADVEYCKGVAKRENDAKQWAQDLNDTLEEYSDAKFLLDQAANAASGITGAISGFAQGGWIGAGAAAAGAAAQAGSLYCQHKMEEAQRDYDLKMRQKQADDALESCKLTVNKSQLQIAGAYATIERRKTDQMNAALQFANMLDENQQTLQDGSNSVDREKERTVSTVEHHYWLSEKVDRYFKEFRWAQRLTYLALRAVEYEFQQTLPIRTDILGASHPDQLEDAVRALQQEMAGRTVNRKRPEESSIVVSLRDDVLRSFDRSLVSRAGERQDSLGVEFGRKLTDPRFGVYDAKGNWVGQGIPFPLGPIGVLANRCGERLWRVTATIQGDGLSDREPGAPVFLLKRNAFASQWCSGLGNGTSMQFASVQPSRKLFSEAGVGELESESNGYTTAMIYPWFNIRRTEFYKLAYRDGASEELAGRGLYGDYILLFPKEILAPQISEETCIATPAVFPLNRVEDVLIRFDYLSVDNLPELLQ